jgi:hypothetical protein
MRRFSLIGWLAVVLLSTASTTSQAAQSDIYVRSPWLGITFISSADHPANDTRYQRALLLGAGWNRWPLYWERVETTPNTFVWNSYDRVVSDDLRHGLRINAILLGRPSFHQQGASIDGLSKPIFSDGSDQPGAGKKLNPDNPWANFVYQAVSRYKPGGVLARQEGWPADWGVQVWEAWNEPDFALFWTASVEDYTRLLKVTYLVTHMVDPQAKVMFGGLASSTATPEDWLARTLGVIARDPMRNGNNWFFDQVAVHSYSYARASGERVRQAKVNMANYGINRPVWLNESGVSVWDDYPGPTWAVNDKETRKYRATLNQQAAYIVQSTAYAWAQGAEVVFLHQLYDDCGNQPAGTDFPPNDGSLCSAGKPCSGDAYGLYRNERNEACFRQSPQPGTPRPAAAAFRVLAEVFGTQPFDRALVKDSDDGAVIKFERLDGGERIYVMWNRTLEKKNVELIARGQTAKVYTLSSDDFMLTPTEGKYKIGLSPATRDDLPGLVADEVAGIGGAPVIVVEKGILPISIALAPLATLANQPIISINLTPTATFNPEATPAPEASLTPSPTIDISRDQKPPTTAMRKLPAISPATFTVSWSAKDDTGIDHYLIWVRIDGGEWKPWLETKATKGEYTGESGKTYEFAAWAQDLSGKWSLNTELTPQAVTKVQ